MIPTTIFVKPNGPSAVEYFTLVDPATLWDEIRNPRASVRDAITQIRALANAEGEAEKHRRKTLKNSLPAFYTALWDDPTCTTSTACTATGMMIIDIDVYDPELIQQTRHKVLNSQLKDRVWALFTSPSGGLKVVLHTDAETDNPQLYSKCYKIVAFKIEQALRKLGVDTQIQADGQCCNVNRSCYLSWDPEIWINPAPVPIKVFDAAAAQLEEEQKEHERAAALRAFKLKNGLIQDDPERLRSAVQYVLSDPNRQRDDWFKTCIAYLRHTQGAGMADLKMWTTATTGEWSNFKTAWRNQGAGAGAVINIAKRLGWTYTRN